MARINLRGVESTKGCSKPNCCTPSRTINRHHRKHQAMFLGIWASRRRGESKWIAFVKRYWEFHPDDCVTICVSHHAEIHAIYDAIILQDIAACAKPLSRYTWDEAERLMAKLEATCKKWEQDDTPGINSKKYGSYKSRSRNKRRKKST